MHKMTHPADERRMRFSRGVVGDTMLPIQLTGIRL
jgi:hypothetical protein